MKNGFSAAWEHIKHLQSRKLIVDTHAHAWQMGAMKANVVEHERARFSEKPVDFSAQLIADMDRHGISKAVLHMGKPVPISLMTSIIDRYPDRFLGFCKFDMPFPGRETAQQQLRERLDSHPAIKGIGEVTFSRFGKQSYEDVLLDLRSVTEVAKERGVPVLFHTGFGTASPLRYYDPSILDELAMAYPEVTIIIGHAGGIHPPFNDLALMVAFKNDNVYLETSKAMAPILQKGLDEIGADRILFGSDWIRPEALIYGPKSERSAHLYERNLEVIAHLRMTEEDREKVLCKNIERLLGNS
ncbi:MAG: amidohydrolase family protein [Deltaproteobacteria bacterium]|nr:amidohydrolase family protein [Deltaproteobacteria bacterium]